MMTKRRELTGKKVLLIAVAAFAVILAANMAMLFAATGTFPGLVVKNSYVASQGWNARAAAQRATGWAMTTGFAAGRLAVAIADADGRFVPGLAVTATVGRPATAAEDRRLDLVETARDYGAGAALGPGQWRLEITAIGQDGKQAVMRSTILVPSLVPGG